MDNKYSSLSVQPSGAAASKLEFPSCDSWSPVLAFLQAVSSMAVTIKDY